MPGSLCSSSPASQVRSGLDAVAAHPSTHFCIPFERKKLFFLHLVLRWFRPHNKEGGGEGGTHSFVTKMVQTGKYSESCC